MDHHARKPRTSTGDRSRNARRQSKKRKFVTNKRNTKFSSQIRENENNERYEEGNQENENGVDAEEENSNATHEIEGFDENGDNEFSGSEVDFTDKRNAIDNDLWFDENEEEIIKEKVDLTVCQDFDININILKQVKEMLQHKMPVDDALPVIIDSNYSKGEFARELNIIMLTHNCSNAVVEDILILFSKCFRSWESHNLPLEKKVIVKYENGVKKEKLIYKSVIDNYVLPYQNSLRFDICKEGCCVFEGTYKDDVRCFNCQTLRFHPCTQYLCKDNFNERDCRHSLTSRKAISFIQYKPIIPLFIQLIRTKGFIDALYYINKDTQAELLTDVNDGCVMKVHMHEMDLNVRRYANNNKDKQFTNVPILLSLFYDGVQVFSTVTSNFWPMVISILNLPPTFRSTVGAGMFMIALFTAIKNTRPEDFLITDCLATEIKKLYNGIFIEIDSKSYFIQARLVMHVLDSPGAAEHLKVHAHRAAGSCALCNAIHGVVRADLGVKWEGHRGMLEETNFLRFFGQSGLCCPVDYHTKKEAFIPIFDGNNQTENTIPASQRLNPVIDSNIHQTEGKIVPIQATAQMLKSLNLCCDVNRSIKENVITAVRTEKYSWHHSEIDPKKLKDILFFHHFDLRLRKEYSRRTNDEYVKNAMAVIELKNKQIEIDEAKHLQGKHVAERAHHVNGVKGLWSPYAFGYADVEHHVAFEPFHIFYDISKNEIENLKNERVSWKQVIFCKSVLCHPCLYPKKIEKKSYDSVSVGGKNIIGNSNTVNEKDTKKDTKDSKDSKKLEKLPNPMWCLSPMTQRVMDSWINALNVPKGYKNHFQVKYVFQRSGKLRGISHIQFLTVLLNFVMSAATHELHEGYLLYYAMLSSDITALMQHSIKNDQIEKMFYKTAETLGTHEGIHPISECNMIFHQMLDVVNHIPKAGPIRGWWALAGERAMGLMKRFLTKGGASFEKTVFDRYCKYEQNLLLSSYNFDVTNYDNANTRSELLREDMCSTELLPDGTSVLTFSDQNILLQKRKLLPRSFYNYYKTQTEEKQELFSVFASYIEKRTISLEDALLKSSFYRIYYFYEKHFYNKVVVNEEFNTLSSWIDFWIHCIDRQVFPHSKFDICHLNPTYELSKSLERGIFYSADFATLHGLQSSSQLVTAFFTESIIFGNKFNSRGFDCHEKKSGRSELRYGSHISNMRYWPDNSNNNLRKNWYKEKHISSWCKFRIKSNRQSYGCEPYDNDSIYMYGQINFFMQIFIPFDPFLNGISLASISCRRHIKHDRVDYILGDDGDSFNPKVKFVPLIDIFSTPIIIGAFHSPAMNEPVTKLSQPHDALTQRGRAVKPTNYKDSNSNFRITNPEPPLETFETECLNRLKTMFIDSQIFHLHKSDKIENIRYANETVNKFHLDDKLSYLVLLDLMPHRNSIKYSLQKDSLYVNINKKLNFKEIESYIIF